MILEFTGSLNGKALTTALVNSLFFTIVIALLTSAIGVVAEPAPNLPDDGNGVTIINALLIDGTGSPARRTSITVQNRKIVGMGAPPLSGSQILDVKGMTVLPGLIDSHVHFQAVPGAVHRKDDASTRRELMYHHLRAHVANGVTTVLDAAIASSALRELRDYLAKGGVGPRVMALGPTAVREMELMVEAGMTPSAVLRSATTTPANMMGIEHLVGTIEMG